MARRLDNVRLAVLMFDGIDLKGRTNVVALGITSDGVKIPLGLWEVCVLDGSKALRKAVRDVLGERAPVERSRPPQGAQCHRSPA